MPRKKRTIVEETLPDDTSTDGGATDFVVVLSKVHRINGNSRPFCFQSNEPVDEVLLQQQYPMGGKFVVTEYNGVGELVNTNHIEIEPAPVSHQQNGNGHGSLEVTLLRDELNHSRTLLVTMLQGMFNNNRQTPITELVTAAQGLNELGKNHRDPIELFIKGMELGKSTGGGGSSDWKTEAVSTVKEVAPYIAQAFIRPPQQPTERQPIMAATTPEAMIQQGLAWIKPQIMAGMQPDLAVSMLVQFANSPQYQPLLATAIQGDINNFIALDPDIANEPYKTWFTNAIQMLKDWYAQQSNPDDDSDGRTRDDSDATDDAPPSSGKSKIKQAV